MQKCEAVRKTKEKGNREIVHNTHMKYTSRRKEKFNSMTVPSTRSANTDMSER